MTLRAHPRELSIYRRGTVYSRKDMCYASTIKNACKDRDRPVRGRQRGRIGSR